jgi:hypothetical protein
LQFLEAQRVVDAATHVLEEDQASWLFILDNRATDGTVVVVRVTKTAAGLSVSSFARLRDGEGQSRAQIADLLGQARRKAE